MTTAVHGACNSPRQQHHQCDLSSTRSTAAPACLTASQHRSRQFLHQNSHQHTHQSTIGGATGASGPATPVYSSVSKYLRPHTAPQTQTHPHIYDGNTLASSNSGSYGTTLNQISYIPMGSSPTVPLQQHGYGSVQLSCGSPVGGLPAEGYRNYWSHTHASTLTYGNGNGRGIGKRKTAVQLLAETKPFFMKSDADRSVIDRLPIVTPSSPGYRKNFLPMTPTPPTSLKRGRGSVSTVNRQLSYAGTLGHATGPEVERRYLPRTPNSRDVTSMHTSHTHIHQHSLPPSHINPHSHQYSHQLNHHHTHHTKLNRHSAPSFSSGNMLQTKLKFLLAPENSRERDRVRDHDRYPISGHTSEMLRKFDYSPSIASENRGGETPIPYMRKEDIVSIPPPLFLSSQSYEDNYIYTGGENSSIDEPLVLTEDYRPISPPAEYAAEESHPNVEGRGRYNYQRSYSHSHEMTAESAKYEVDTFNINSHKSLPDLHTQISRHSPHSEILSCCSRGNRSNKSVGESSLNRDSGGSSGHYTHRSEPCYRQRESERDNYDAGKPICCSHAVNAAPIEIRRDSGSSTQHSANSYGGYVSTSMYGRAAAECVACRCSRKSASYDASCDYLLNIPTPVVPEAFQDDYTPPQMQAQSAAQSRERRYYSSSSHQQQQHQHHQEHQIYAQTTPQGHSNIRLPPNTCIAQSPGSTPSMEDISPPPIEFKRQKCIRLKNRNRIPAPNVVPLCNNNAGNTINGGSNSSNAGYGHNDSPHTFLFPKCISTNSDDYGRMKPFVGGNSRRSSCERVQNVEVAISATLQPLPPVCPGEIEQPYPNYAREIITDEISDLESFFDRMGLNDEKFNEIYTASRRRRSGTTTDSDDSSTVFFSDVSTVDSMRLPDSTETQPQTTQPYRPSEPTSIVERNARIIKWLVNMRKLEQQI